MRLEELGQRIARLRHEAGLSGRVTAERAGISPAYLRALEMATNPKTGRASRPSVSALLGIASALRADSSGLLELAGYDPEIARNAFDRNPMDARAQSIQESIRLLQERPAFLREAGDEQLNRFAAQLRSVALGRLYCSVQDEPLHTKLALRQCQSSIYAVSFQDLDWWNGHQGAEYLDIHQELLARSHPVSITRIFVSPWNELERLASTLNRHVEMGIATRVVDQDQVTDQGFHDFVIYDELLLRTGSPIVEGNDSSRTAVFTDDVAQIEQALIDFRILVKRSQPASDVLGRMSRS